MILCALNVVLLRRNCGILKPGPISTCMTPLQRDPLWSLSRGEVLQLLPYLDCLKSVKQSSMTSEINSCWPFLQVNSTLLSPALTACPRPATNHLSWDFSVRLLLERDSCLNITEIIPTEISSTSSACQRREQEVLVDETLTVIVAQKLRRSTGLISTLLVNMNHFHTKACRYRIENTGKMI